MKHSVALTICALLLIALCSCGASVPLQAPQNTEGISESVRAYEIGAVYAHIGKNVLEITLCDNSSAPLKVV